MVVSENSMKIIENYFPRYSYHDWMRINIGEIETLAVVRRDLWIGQYNEGVNFDYLREDFISELKNEDDCDDNGEQIIWIYSLMRNSV